MSPISLRVGKGHSHKIRGMGTTSGEFIHTFSGVVTEEQHNTDALELLFRGEYKALPKAHNWMSWNHLS